MLIASSILNFGLGTMLRRRPTFEYLLLAVIPNILLLWCIQVSATDTSGGDAGWQAGLAHYIIMPVGMSFWTFQALSYLMDIYREEEIDPTLLEFCLYMAFWPTVFSGPVCRLPDMLPQFRKEPKGRGTTFRRDRSGGPRPFHEDVPCCNCSAWV